LGGSALVAVRLGVFSLALLFQEEPDGFGHGLAAIRAVRRHGAAPIVKGLFAFKARNHAAYSTGKRPAKMNGTATSFISF